MIHVFVPAATDANGDEQSRNAWAILRGKTNPPTVLAFCWDRDVAKEIYEALNKAAGERCCWVSPAILSEHDPR